MAASTASASPQPEKKKQGTYNRIGSSTLFDVTATTTKRQLNLPEALYDGIKELNIDLKPRFGKISIHDTMLVLLQVGILVLKQTPEAGVTLQLATGNDVVTKRQMDIPENIYDDVKRASMNLKSVYGKLSLHDALLLILRVGVATLKENSEAPREQPG